MAKQGVPMNIALIKPLEWEDRWTENPCVNSRSQRRIMERALTPFHAYFLEYREDDSTWWVTKYLLGDEISGPHEEAWEARQAVEEIFHQKLAACFI
jgi:hypothetical protein